MAVTVEELEIVIQAKIQDALNGLETVQKKLMETATKVAPQFNKQMQAAMSGLALNLVQPIEKAQQQMRSATEKTSAASKRQTDLIVQQQKDIETAVQRATDRLKEQASATGKLSLPDSVPTKSSKLASQIIPDSLKTNFMQQESAGVQKASEIIAQSITRVNEVLSGMEQTARQATGSLAAQMQNINAKIEAQQGLLDELREKFRNAVSATGTVEGTAKIQQQILVAESALMKLVEQYNKVSSAAQAAGEQMKKATAIVPAGGEDLTITLGKLDAMRDAKAAKGLSEEYENLDKNTEKVKKSMDGKNKTLQRQTKDTGRESKAVKVMASAFASAKAKIDRAKKALSDFGNTLKKVLLAAGAYKAITAIGNFIKEGIKSAISAPEIENMFNVAFGSMAYEADQFARKLKDAFGLDVIASKQMLATFQNFQISMGIGSRTAAKMSKTLTQLAYDMASLYEMDSQQVFENLQSGLQGMPRALYKYGIAITEANVKQTALRYGLIKQGQEMTSQQKVIARYITILEQTKTSQGDLARTLQSPANQLRIFRSQMTAAGRAIGEAFLPLIQAIVPWLNAFAIVLQRVGTSFARFTYSLFGRDYDAEKKQAQEELKNLEDITNAEKDVGKEAEKTKKKIQNMLGPFDELYVIQQKTDKENENLETPNLEWDVPTLPEPEGENPYEKLADRIMDKLREIFKVFRQAWENEGQNTIDAAKYAFESLLEAIKAVGRSFSEVWNNGTGLEFVENILRIAQLIFNVIGDIASAFTIAWENAGTGTALIQQIFDSLNAVMELVLSIGKAFREAWNDGRGVEIWDAILSIATNVFAIVENLADRLRAAWEQNDNGVKIWGHILDIVQDVLDFLDRIAQATANWAAQLDFGPLVGSFENLLGVIEQLVDSILNGLGWAYENVLLPFGTWLIQTAAPAFLDAVAAVLGSSVWQTAAEAIKNLYENALLPLAQWAGDAFMGFLTWIQENGDIVAGIIIAIGAAFAGWAAIQGIVSAVAGVVQLAAGAFIAVQTAAATLSGIVSALGAAFSFLLSPLGLIIAAVVGLTAEFVYLYQTSETFRNKVTEGINAVKELFQPLWEIVKSVFDNIVRVLTDFWENHLKVLMEKISEFVRALGEAAIQVIEVFIKPFADAFSALGPIVSDIVNTIVNTVGALVAALADLVGDALEILTGVLDFLVGVFSADWEKIWKGVQEVFSGVWNFIGDFLKGTIQTLDSLIYGFVGTVVNAINKILEFIGIKDKAEEAASDIGESVSQGTAQKIIEQKSVPENAAMEMVESTVAIAENTAATNAPRVGTAYGDGMSSGIDQTVPQVQASTTQLTDSITIPLSALIAEGEGTYSTGASIVQNLAKGITDNLQLVNDAINKLAETIKTAMQQALSLGESSDNAFYQYGVEIVQGLAQGISENTQIITDTLNQTAEAINTAFKELFQIEDYSMVFYNYGMGFMQGLAQGVTEGIEIVRETFLAVGEAINTALNEALAVLGGEEMGEGGSREQDSGGGNGNAFYQFGTKLMMGLSQGITDTLPVVLETITVISTSIIDAFKQAFLIDEFSQVFFDFGVLFMQSLADGITEGMALVQEQMEALAELITQLYTDFIAEFSKTLSNDLESINQIVSDQMDEMVNIVSQAVDEAAKEISSLISKINSAISKARELQSIASSVGGYSSGRNARRTVSYSADIPQFASGAVLRSPTVGLMAEYAGAASNPEIVTPQNILQETMIESMFPAVSALSAKLDVLIEAVRQGRVEIKGDAAEFLHVMKKADEGNSIMTGQSIFAPF